MSGVRFHDDGFGRIWRLSAGAYGGHTAVVRCREDDLPYVLREMFPGLFEPVEYPEQREDESDEEYGKRCEAAEVDLTVVNCEAIPSWEWGYAEASPEDVIAWKVWFAEQYM